MSNDLQIRGVALIVVLAAGAGEALAQGALPYGPDTCIQGFVWREAYPGDHVCVPPASRDGAAGDNARAAERRQPGGGAYGPDTCRPGFVWREARPDDHVCVTPSIRTQTARENQIADSRRAQAQATRPPPPPPPAYVAKPIDEHCDQYAGRAVRQFRLTSRAGCAVNPSGRWQGKHTPHYEWCLTASSAARASEQEARDQWLYKCGAQSRID